jgi:hypothetical protein
MAQVQGRLLEMPVGLQDLAQLNHSSKTEVIIVMLIWVKKWGALCRSICLYFNVPNINLLTHQPLLTSNQEKLMFRAQ